MFIHLPFAVSIPCMCFCELINLFRYRNQTEQTRERMGSKWSCSGSLSLVSQLLPLSIARTLNDAGAAIAQTPLVGEMQVPPPSILLWTALCVSPSLRPKSTAIAVVTPVTCYGCFDSQGSEFIISAFSVLRLFCCSNTPPLPPEITFAGILVFFKCFMLFYFI